MSRHAIVHAALAAFAVIMPVGCPNAGRAQRGMLTMRHGFSIGLTVMAILIGSGFGPVAVAEDPPHALIGRWEGTATFGESSPSVLVFSNAGGSLKWTYSFKYAVLWGMPRAP